MRRGPMTWFFAISLGIDLVVVAVFLLSGAATKLEAAIPIRASGLGERTDFVSAGRLMALELQSWFGVLLSILQPFSPDIAAFVVAGLAFGLGGVVVLVRRYRCWSNDVGGRRACGSGGLCSSPSSRCRSSWPGLIACLPHPGASSGSTRPSSRGRSRWPFWLRSSSTSEG